MLEIRDVRFSDGSRGNIAIAGEKIVSTYIKTQKRKLIDGKGYLALPGPIDTHVHFRVPGGEHKETWETGCLSAKFGGVTTVFDMPNTNPALTTVDGIEKKTKHIGNPEINYRFWFGATPNNISEIIEARKDPRIIGVKVYMGSSTGDLLVCEDSDIRKIFLACAEHGITVAVHAEDEALMRKNIASLGRPARVSDHCVIREPQVEISAVRRALKLQRETGCRLYFCHLSTPKSLELVRDAKDSGAEVFTEVCPHHILLSSEKVQGDSGAYFKMNPPLRGAQDIAIMQDYVCREGFVDTIGSDHAPHTREEKENKEYEKVQSGVPGVQTILPLLLTFMLERFIPIDHFVDLTSRNAAKIFKLGSKGDITHGHDADIVLADTDHERIIQNSEMATKCRWTPFDGYEVCVQPKMVICQGAVSVL